MNCADRQISPSFLTKGEWIYLLWLQTTFKIGTNVSSSTENSF